VRIDRWLWCARWFKTRSLAAGAVRGGQIRLGGRRIKAAREVRIGDRLDIRRGDALIQLCVRKIPSRRGPPAEAAALYAETPDSIRRREAQTEARRSPRPLPATRGRPDKRTRRLERDQRRGG